ncbi:MAG: nucleotidyltransferase domain-containing protein [Bacteroidetes bacterium]|nr:nucleotidyltransferase domain-containing protein [Bacteroidota bacterium]MCW5895060.1 nucleotidyltransferase domain-containing protein [Bacteroidota bacterium]
MPYKNGRISREAPSTREAIELAKRYVEKLRQNRIAVAMAYLYGSFARGDFHKDSDIDIVVVSEEFNHSRFEDSLRIAKLRYDIDLRISPLAYHPDDFTDENMIPHEAMTEGIRVA